MTQMNLNPDFSTAQDIHCSLEINTEISDLSGHGLNTLHTNTIQIASLH